MTSTGRYVVDFCPFPPFKFLLLGALEQIKVDASGIPEEKQVTKIT